LDYQNFNILQDQKLNKLWGEVQTSEKFNQFELDRLFVEFKHHEDKLTELHLLNSEAEETNGMI